MFRWRSKEWPEKNLGRTGRDVEWHSQRDKAVIGWMRFFPSACVRPKQLMSLRSLNGSIRHTAGRTHDQRQDQYCRKNLHVHDWLCPTLIIVFELQTGALGQGLAKSVALPPIRI